MTAARIFVAGLGAVLAVAVQGTVIARLPLPGGLPNLPLLVVVGVALAAGTTAGLACGFGTGLAADVLSDHPVGLLALCLALVGFGVGLLEPESDRGALRSLLAVAVAAAAAQLGYAALLGLLGAGGGTAVAELPSTVAYDVLLAPFVLPVVIGADRRLRSVVA
ncbi:MAG TPA: rod shape-determining protein MreD [Mycobacteriales bacterium]|nr:rod shape-determining protein MreD [Mycobacteriales bacterium]